jgi:antitoxin MazE
MVTTHIRKWGNSLAVRFPHSLLAQLDLHADGEVEIRVEDGRLILLPVEQPEAALEALLAKITPENRHGETSFGLAVGREEW